MIRSLTPRVPPHALGRIVLACCRSEAELRALYRQDLSFQKTLVRGYDPRWVYKNWRPKGAIFKGQRMSWVLTGILARHVSTGYMLMGLSILIPFWLIVRLRQDFARKFQRDVAA